MKRLLTIAIIAAVGYLMASTSAFAASAEITITATVSGVQGVQLSATTWAIDAISTEESADSSTIEATNTGTGPETLELAAAATGDFGLAAEAGVDKIAIWGKCAATDPTLTKDNALDGIAGQTSEAVNPDEKLKVWLKYHAPTEIGAGKTKGDATVTVSTKAP